MYRPLAALSLLACTGAAMADPIFPLGREMAGDADLPLPYGVSLDLFALEQPYGIERLAFTLPGFTLDDTSVIDVENRIHDQDLKFDVWVLPFLNVFGIAGYVNARTNVDLSRVPLPVNLGVLPVRYSGSVFGGGATAIYGGKNWFVSVTGTYTDTNLSGDFDSNVHSITWQPRLGWVHGNWSVWGGGFYLDVKERHAGDFNIPLIGTIPFEVELRQEEHWSPSVGVHYDFNKVAEVSLEIGGGSGRTTTLLNLGFRFD